MVRAVIKAKTTKLGTKLSFYAAYKTVKFFQETGIVPEICEVKDNKGNIFESQTKNNLYWIEDKLFNNNEIKKSIFMKDLLLKRIDIVKLEFEKTMAKTKISRRQTWENYSFTKYIMQEVVINISPAWWEKQKLVSYHEEDFIIN